jgi:phosphoribosylformylglycinamidine synthase subunit PurL
VKWDLDFAIVGETIPEDRFLILHGNEVKADLPLVESCRPARRNMTGPGWKPRRRPFGPVPEIDPIAGCGR